MKEERKIVSQCCKAKINVDCWGGGYDGEEVCPVFSKITCLKCGKECKTQWNRVGRPKKSEATPF